MRTDRVTQSLLAAIVVLLGTLVLRPSSPGGAGGILNASAAMAAQQPPDRQAADVAPRVAAPEAAQRGSLQVSGASDGGLVIFDPTSGDVVHVARGPEKIGVDWRASVRKNADGKWAILTPDTGVPAATGEPGGRAPDPNAPPALPDPVAAARMAETTRVTTAQADLTTIRAALNAFRIDNGRFPSTEEGLQSLVVQPGTTDNWKGPYLTRGVPKDPWGNPYVYRFPGRSNPELADLVSFGPDRREAGGDDLQGK